MPNRLLRESILDSEAVNTLTPQGEVFYRRLMSVVDDFGRFDARPAVLRSRLYPLQLPHVRETDVARWIAECVKANLVRLYDVNSSQYLLFHKLGEPRAKSSKFPPPPDEPCAHVRADENICAHPRAYVPPTPTPAPTDTPTENTPPPPSGGRASKSASARPPPIPPPLDTAEFGEAWAEWLEHRRQKGNKVTPISAVRALRKLQAMGTERAVIALQESVANGWTGVFPPDERRASANGRLNLDGLKAAAAKGATHGESGRGHFVPSVPQLGGGQGAERGTG